MTWRHGGFSGSIMDPLSHVSHLSPSLHLFPSPPHPPYNSLHLASRLIVYFMIITPFTPDHTIFWAYSSFSMGSLFFQLSIASFRFSFMTRGTKPILGTQIATPVVRTISIPSHTSLPFLLTGRTPPTITVCIPSIYLSSRIC